MVVALVMAGVAIVIGVASIITMTTVQASSSNSNSTIDYDAIKKQNAQEAKQMVESAHLNKTCLSSSDRLHAMANFLFLHLGSQLKLA